MIEEAERRAITATDEVAASAWRQVALSYRHLVELWDSIAAQGEQKRRGDA